MGQVSHQIRIPYPYFPLPLESLAHTLVCLSAKGIVGGRLVIIMPLGNKHGTIAEGVAVLSLAIRDNRLFLRIMRNRYRAGTLIRFQIRVIVSAQLATYSGYC